MLKKIIILLIILFFYVFMKSDTLEQKQFKEEREGVEYLRTTYRLNWNNFGDYLQDTYDTAIKKLQKLRR
ncbi:MAG: hypothetical protein ACOY3D_03935 [Candidatus Omnitrophota bacterium]